MTDTENMDSEVDAEDLFAKRFSGETTAPAEVEETPETEATGEEPVAEETTEETEEVLEEPTKTLAGDDALVVVKIGDEERQVPVAELKALFSQREDLTAKSAAVQESLKRVDAEGEKAVGLLSEMIRRAEEKFSPYAKVDFALAAQRLDEASYKQLRSDAEEAYRDLNFLKAEGNAFLAQARDNRARLAAEAMKTADETLAADPETKGWTSQSRAEVVDYAVKLGLQEAATIANPAALKILRKAMLFDRGAKAVAEKVKPVATSAPKRTLKPGSTDNASGQTTKAREVMSRLRASGSLDDAAAAFAHRFSSR